MQVLILSDSIALPRDEPEKVVLKSTWPRILRGMLEVDIIQNSIGAATSADLLKQTFYYKTIAPDIVLVQCGIVDLAPRAFLPHEIALLERFKITKRLLKLVRSKTDQIRKFRQVTYVSQSRFKQHLLSFKNEFKERLYWINVPEGVHDYENRVPGIAANIKRYNNVIDHVFGNHVIDVREFGQEEVMSDHHHFNESGHLKLAMKIVAKLKEQHAIK